jgi:transcriptional regulator with XRE-family HTH domain
MNFRLLQTRLVTYVRARVRNGEISERALARLTGISQPHIHNVLKGNKALSLDKADQILQRLRINLLDLLAADTSVTPRQEPEHSSDWRMVEILDGWVGPEFPYPQTAGRERYPFPLSALELLYAPVAARLAPDPLRAPMFSGRCVVLLDRSEQARCELDEEGYFAVDLGRGGTIGMVRRAGRRLCLWVHQADVWQSILLPDRGPLDLIQGRVRLVVRQL